MYHGRYVTGVTEQTLKAIVAEFVGGFCFFFIAAGAVVTDAYIVARGGQGLGLVGMALASGLGLAALVCAFGHVSGAHFNPAVTVAAAIGRRISIRDGALYVVAQLLAAALAGFTLRAIFPADAWQSVNLGAQAVAADVSFGAAVMIEAILTFILVIVIFGAALDARAPGAGGFAIGLTVAAGILVGGPLTGGSMNPARTFGPALAANFWDSHLVYWLGPLIGAVFAGLVYGWFFMNPQREEGPA